MVHIVLLILKIIGIILLAIFALCLLILFFPVTYKVKGEFDKTEFCFQVQCGWLFHFIHFGGKFSDKEKKAKLRFLGIPIDLLKEKKKSKRETNLTKEKKHKKSSDEKMQKKVLSKDKEFRKNIEKQTDKKLEEQCQENNERLEEQTPDKEERKSFLDKAKDFFRMVYQFLKKVQRMIKNALENVKGTYQKAKEIKAFVTANTTKEAYRYGKRIVIKAIRHIFPKKIKGSIQFGFEEPDVTGKMLGYIAMTFAAFHINPKKILIEPYFDKKVIKGNIKIKGHFLLGILLIYALKFYFKKEIRDIIKKFS